MKLKILKQQLQKEEQAFKKLRDYYPYFATMEKREILQYLHFETRKELVAYVDKLDVVSKPSEDTLSKVCHCRDANGIPKNLYMTEKEAQRAKEYLMGAGRETVLKIYSCPTEKGWHLTKV